MGSRSNLHSEFESILGSKNVYFQPPESVKLQYPCIIYERDKIDTTFANDNPYSHRKKYNVTVIDKDPDSDIPDRVSNLPTCKFDRHFISDNLNHDVFNIYY